jgi:hypothetical protein
MSRLDVYRERVRSAVAAVNLCLQQEKALLGDAGHAYVTKFDVAERLTRNVVSAAAHALFPLPEQRDKVRAKSVVVMPLTFRVFSTGSTASTAARPSQAPIQRVAPLHAFARGDQRASGL